MVDKILNDINNLTIEQLKGRDFISNLTLEMNRSEFKANYDECVKIFTELIDKCKELINNSDVKYEEIAFSYGAIVNLIKSQIDNTSYDFLIVNQFSESDVKDLISKRDKNRSDDNEENVSLVNIDEVINSLTIDDLFNESKIDELWKTAEDKKVDGNDLKDLYVKLMNKMTELINNSDVEYEKVSASINKVVLWVSDKQDILDTMIDDFLSDNNFGEDKIKELISERDKNKVNNEINANVNSLGNVSLKELIEICEKSDNFDDLCWNKLMFEFIDLNRLSEFEKYLRVVVDNSNNDKLKYFVTSLLKENIVNSEELDVSLYDLYDKSDKDIKLGNEDIQKVNNLVLTKKKITYDDELRSGPKGTDDEREIDKIFRRIDELEKVVVPENIEEEIRNLEEKEKEVSLKYDEDIMKLNSQIFELSNQLKNGNISLNNSKYDGLTLDELEDNLSKLKEKQAELWQYSAQEANGMESNELDEVNAQIKEIEEEISRRKTGFEKISDEELNAKLVELKEKQADLWQYSVQEANGMESNELDEINSQIKKVEFEIANRKIQKYEKLSIEELNRLLDELVAKKHAIEQSALMSQSKPGKDYDDVVDQIKEVEEEISNREKRKYEKLTDEELKAKLVELKEKQAELWQYSVQEANGMESNELDEVNAQIKEIEEEISRRSKNNGLSREELEKKLKELQGQRKNKIAEKNKALEPIRNELKEKCGLANSKFKLDNYKRIKDAYYSLRDELIEKLNSDEEFINKTDEEKQVEIEKLLNDEAYKDKISVLNSYPKVSELKSELVEEIKANLKKKLKHENENSKLWLKALSAVAGFGLGYACAMVPGVGTIRMGIAGIKLAGSVINTITKDEEGKGAITRLTDKITDKYKDTKIVQIINKIRENLNSPYVKLFVNGYSAGYFVGNIVEVSGIFDVKAEEVPTNTPSGNTGNVGNTDVVSSVSNAEETTDIVNEVVSEVSNGVRFPNIGESVDLSQLSQGFVSSTSVEPVNLMTKVGSNVTLDKIVTLPDGTEMCHFLQSNGQGYAWFRVEDVKDVLDQVSKGISR